MANDKLCVFCGQKLGVFSSTTVPCGNTWQPACKDCEKELQDLDELELCQRALIRGMAQEPERLRAQIELLTEAENHRPTCLRCGGKLFFEEVQELDNSPHRDSILSDPFTVRPAYCANCGRYELYRPDIVRKNKYLAHLIWKDTQE